MVLDTPEVRSIKRFKQIMGLWFWGPSVCLAAFLSVLMAQQYGQTHTGLFAAMCALGLCAVGWFLRFCVAGARASVRVATLHRNVPWDSLRVNSQTPTELDRINTLEGFMACDPSERRVMGVMPMLIALVSIMELVVLRSQGAVEP